MGNKERIHAEDIFEQLNLLDSEKKGGNNSFGRLTGHPGYLPYQDLFRCSQECEPK